MQRTKGNHVTRTLPAIPTTYKGVRYRSRLEARYAAFFDALGWTHAYEPLELNGYIPDFLITRGPTFDGPLLVECKPFVDASGIDAQDAVKVAQKIAKAWHGSALIVSAVHHVESHGGGSRVRIGRMWIDRTNNPRATIPSGPWCDAYVCRLGTEWSLLPAFDEWVAVLGSADLFAARMAWNDAGNATQWKAPA